LNSTKFITIFLYIFITVKKSMSLIGNLNNYRLNEIPRDALFQTEDDTDISHVQIKAKITYSIYDKDGRLIKKWSEPAKSLTYWYALLEYNLWMQGTISMTDTTGTSITPYMGSPGTIDVEAGSGVTTYGILVGSGNTSNVSQKSMMYNLVALIPNGTGAGQLTYQSVSFGTPNVSGNTSTWTLSRSFINQSGGTVTVTEVGIVALLSGFRLVNSVSSALLTSDYFLIAYDIPSSAISLSNGQTLNITYTYQVVA
jgi:hypothetical protein